MIGRTTRQRSGARVNLDDRKLVEEARHGDHARFPGLCLLKRSIQVAPGRQRNHLKAVRKRLDDAQRAATNGAGGTENGDFLHATTIVWKSSWNDTKRFP